LARDRRLHRLALRIAAVHRVIFVDYTPGRIAAWDPAADQLLIRSYEHVDHEETQRAEMAAIEIGLEVLDGVDGIILTDSLGAVRLIHGKRSHPSAGSAAELAERAAAIRENLGGSIVAWIPRKANLADGALRRSSDGAHD
jgi:hypothetical protein